MGELLAAILSPLLEVGKWIYGKFQKPDPVQVLKRREELRREFEEHLPIIYCRLKDGQPYESVPFFWRYTKDDEFLVEVEGFRPWDKKKRFWQR